MIRGPLVIDFNTKRNSCHRIGYLLLDLSIKVIQMAEQSDSQTEIQKLNTLISKLNKSEGECTDLVSLLVTPGEDLLRIQRLLQQEMGFVSCIKSRSKRLRVLAAIEEVKHRIDSYSQVPPNGLVIFHGKVMSEYMQTEEIHEEFEPFRPITTSLYRVDNIFYTEPLLPLLTPIGPDEQSLTNQ